MFLDGSLWVSEHTERETGCVLEGRAVWPGLWRLLTSWDPVILHSESVIYGLSTAHWVWTWEWDRWRENRNKPMKPNQRQPDLEDSQGTHDDQAESLGAQDNGPGPPGGCPGTDQGRKEMLGLPCTLFFPSGLAKGTFLNSKGCSACESRFCLPLLLWQVVPLPRGAKGHKELRAREGRARGSGLALPGGHLFIFSTRPGRKVTRVVF